jgi:hypothetical protein
MPKSTDSPAFPTYDLATVFSVKAKLVEMLSLEYFACRPVGEDFESMVSRISGIVPAPRVHLFESLRTLAGMELNDDTIERLSWRLAGNLRKLKRGPVHPWTRQTRREWAPLAVMEVHPTTIETFSKSSQRKIHKSGGDMTFLVLAGSPAGTKINTFWSMAYVHTIKMDFGFSRFDRSAYTHVVTETHVYPFVDIRELTRLRFFGLFDPDASQEGPTFIEVANSGTLLKWNRKILRMRQRIEYACPLQYDPDQIPCAKCEMGYDRCKAACHPNTYVLQLCPSCHRETWFDTRTSSTNCIDCTARGS